MVLGETAAEGRIQQPKLNAYRRDPAPADGELIEDSRCRGCREALQYERDEDDPVWHAACNDITERTSRRFLAEPALAFLPIDGLNIDYVAHVRPPFHFARGGEQGYYSGYLIHAALRS